MSRTLDYTTYLDKIHGGWIGKCAGGILGAPIEGIKAFNQIELSEKLFEINFPNDDLDLQVLWLDMVKQKGPWVRENDFADHWKQHVRFPWGEYGVASRNIELGVYPPESGTHNNHYWYRGMGSPIRSEIWGMLCPGMPERAAFYAEIDSSLDHRRFSIDAEKFLSACASEAFFESDLRTLFQVGLSLFSEESELHQMVTTVMNWAEKCSYEVAMGKIKSFYGDADFTSAPMNIAFTLLALLRSEGSFDGIMDALHLGHDSDCVVATAGALLGITKGYENLDPKWKELVGYELLVSPEIVGIEHADTISGLAQETAQAGIAFIQHFDETQLSNAPEVNLSSPLPCHINVYRSSEDTSELTVKCENYTGNSQSIKLIFQSDDLIFPKNTLELSAAGREVVEQTISFQIPETSFSKPARTYSVEVQVDGEQVQTLQRALAYYGNWLLLGPFIQDDPDLAPMDEDYPDHGLASLPSFQYMNQDRVNTDTDFITLEQVRKIAGQKNYDAQPFMVQEIQPSGFVINLCDYYLGRGERTLYLYTKLRSTEARQVWLTMGCSVYFRVWANGKLVRDQQEIQRCWPYATRELISLQAGENDLLIRVDSPVDEINLEVGFKDFAGKHAHQSFWNTDLVPHV
ncbi:MAG: ADP-ribosylglycohydrolase family protein [Bacteroidota bacterium]